jgi:DNA-binding NarL/FixJ family response regulator
MSPLGSPDHGPIRVVVADDQAMVRAGFSSLLETEPDIAVVGEAANGAEACTLAEELHADVVLMDIRMPVMDGLAATRRLAQTRAASRVLVLTTFDLDEYVFGALHAGASGFLLKDARAEDLAEAIRVVARGEAMLDPAVTRRVIDTFVDRGRPSHLEATERLAPLTRREREVLGLLARGLSNTAIAARLFISEATTKTHVSSILAKLHLTDRVQAVIAAYECGLVIPGVPDSPPPD